jgi:tetratricopeptide (TPR) repeat protein
MGEKTHFSTLVEVLSNVVYMQGRYPETEELTRECEEAARSNDVHAQIRWRAVRAKAIARKGEFESADELAREAVAFAADNDFLNDHADALLDQAEVLRLGGRRAEASSAVEGAVALYERKGNVVSRPRRVPCSTSWVAVLESARKASAPEGASVATELAGLEPATAWTELRRSRLRDWLLPVANGPPRGRPGVPWRPSASSE